MCGSLCVDIYAKHRLNRIPLLLLFKACVRGYRVLRIGVAVFADKLLVRFGVIRSLFVGRNNNRPSRRFALPFTLLFRVFVNFSDTALRRFGRRYSEIIIDNHTKLTEARIIPLGSEL